MVKLVQNEIENKQALIKVLLDKIKELESDELHIVASQWDLKVNAVFPVKVFTCTIEYYKDSDVA